MVRVIIGVMGIGDAAPAIVQRHAYDLGVGIAQQGWVLLTGGRNVGVMEAASRGAQSVGGLTVGILPGHDRQGLSAAIDIPIVTDLGNGRNNVNVLSSDVVIACGLGSGTASEIALALKAQKSVILLDIAPEDGAFFQRLAPDLVHRAETVAIALELARTFLPISP